MNNITLEIYRNTAGVFELDNYAVETGTAESRVLQGLTLDIATLFAT